MKCAIFIDFWNYELTMREFEGDKFRTNWFELPNAIIKAVSSLLGSPVTYESCHIFGSYNPESQAEINLKKWANTTLPKVVGVRVDFAGRQKRTKGPCCTGKTHHEITECPICKATMLGTQEKGVDIRLATEMLHAGYSGLYDVAVLVSADKDYIPMLQKLQTKGIKVVYAYFPNHGNELSKHVHASFNLYDLRASFQR